MTAVEQERRLTPTERLHEVTMAAMARRPSEAEHGVEISRNAKGVAQFTITVRGPNFGEVLEQARSAFDNLCFAYPYPTANGGTE